MQDAGGARKVPPAAPFGGPWWATLMLGLALTVGFWLWVPQLGGGDSYLLRARVLLGGTPPGFMAPEFPGSSGWIAYFLAALQWIMVHLAGASGEAIPAALDRIEPGIRQLLPVLWATLAAGLTLLSASLAARLASTTGRRALAAGLALVLVAISPGLHRGVAYLSPAVPGALLLLWLTARLGSISAPSWSRAPAAGPSLAAGARDGVVLGMLLAWAPYAWLLLPLYGLSLWVLRQPWGRILPAVLIALGLGFALDVSRLIDPGGALARIHYEWGREGGWDVLGGVLGTGSWNAIALGASWERTVVLGVALLTALSLARRGRWPLLVWASGLWLVLNLLPAVSGVGVPGAVQAIADPFWVVLAAVGLAALPNAPVPRPFWLYRGIGGAAILSIVLVGGWPNWRQRAALVPAELGRQIAEVLAAHPPGHLCLAERPLPGGVDPGSLFVLPRDSRDPGRYDFVYWPRWYCGFEYVLLAETQVRSNLARGARVPAHFYGQLASEGRAVAEFGDPVAYRLFQLRPTADWRKALTREEMAALQPAGELAPFLSQLGSAYAESGQLKLAGVIFQEGVRLAPESDALANNLGSVYLLEQEWEEAARVFQGSLERRPDSPEILYNYGRALFELNVYMRAEDLYRRALGLRPGFAAAHYEIARCFLAQGKETLAADALRRYLALAPDSPRRAAVEEVLATLSGSVSSAVPPGVGAGLERIDSGSVSEGTAP